MAALAFPWWRRLNIEAVIKWSMPADMALSKWAFDPFAALVLPGQPIRADRFLRGTGQRPGEAARYFWCTAAIRLLGLDIGAAVFLSLAADPQQPTHPREATQERASKSPRRTPNEQA